MGLPVPDEFFVVNNGVGNGMCLDLIIVAVLVLTIRFLLFPCLSLALPPHRLRSFVTHTHTHTGPIPLKTEPMDGDGADDTSLGDLSPITTKDNKNGGEKDKIHNINNGNGVGGGEEGGVVKANKGMILRKSVEYIRWVFLFCACLCFELS